MVWLVVPFVGFEPVPVVVVQLLVAGVTRAVAAAFYVGLAGGIQLVFVLHAARGGEEQALPVDFQFEPAYSRRFGDGLFPNQQFNSRLLLHSQISRISLRKQHRRRKRPVAYMLSLQSSLLSLCVLAVSSRTRSLCSLPKSP